MNDAKHPLESLTVWATIGSGVVAALAISGVKVDADNEQLDKIYKAAAMGFMLYQTLRGRWRASQKLQIKK